MTRFWKSLSVFVVLNHARKCELIITAVVGEIASCIEILFSAIKPALVLLLPSSAL